MKKLYLVSALLFVITSVSVAKKTYDYEFFLQPYKGTAVFNNDKRVNFRVLMRDNSLARIGFDNSSDKLYLTFKNINFDEKKMEISKGEKKFVILDKKGLSYSFENIYPTGIQPKSVTFINSTQVCMPLLADTGADIINIFTGETIRIAPPEPYKSQKGFVESLVIKEKNELWISQMSAGAAHVFDLKTLKYKTTVKVTGKWSKVLEYNPSNNKVYLTNWITQDISVINPDTYKEEYKIKVGGVPRGIIFSNDNKYAYVCQYTVGGRARGHVLKIDLASNRIIKTLGVPGAKRHMVKDAERNIMYVSDMARAAVFVYDLSKDKLIKRIPVFSHPNTIQLSPDKKSLYVSCRGRNNPDKGYLYKGYHMGRIYIINTDILKVAAFFEGGNQCTGLDVSPDGKRFVFSDFLDERIRIYKRN